ncbi:hypothetical protein QC764_302992 [Podospora pseudoanserina]|uniref:Uncharacterized protein n=1 Tax=Podospora pseudoanserina TaxID=2609844 RepID=A0ABR0IC41_9PEZI|nr:hypothetical protein QC764_302992 [Podospora pseudoanserina]
MGCLSTLKIWRKRGPAPKPVVTHAKVVHTTSRDSSRSTATYDEKHASIATEASSLLPFEEARLEEKEAGDPEVARRRRAEEEKKRQAEREEQERLDFFQMM